MNRDQPTSWTAFQRPRAQATAFLILLVRRRRQHRLRHRQTTVFRPVEMFRHKVAPQHRLKAQLRQKVALQLRQAFRLVSNTGRRDYSRQAKSLPVLFCPDSAVRFHER